MKNEFEIGLLIQVYTTGRFLFKTSFFLFVLVSVLCLEYWSHRLGERQPIFVFRLHKFVLRYLSVLYIFPFGVLYWTESDTWFKTSAI